MKCSNCGKQWHIPSQGGVLMADGKPYCCLTCVDEAREKEKKDE